jgi:hypothetical protein
MKIVVVERLQIDAGRLDLLQDVFVFEKNFF